MGAFVLHLANLANLRHGDATKAYHLPTLPYPLLHQESLLLKQKMTPDCPQEELGGFEPITVEEWSGKQIFANQPKWRLDWFRKHPELRTYYAKAPRQLRIDPLFCPNRRRRT